jgi:hypothetical protein
MKTVLMICICMSFTLNGYACGRYSDSYIESQKERVKITVDNNKECNFVTLEAPEALDGHSDLKNLSVFLTVSNNLGAKQIATSINVVHDKSNKIYTTGFCIYADNSQKIDLSLTYSPTYGILKCESPSLKFENVQELVNNSSQSSKK